MLHIYAPLVLKLSHELLQLVVITLTHISVAHLLSDRWLPLVEGVDLIVARLTHVIAFNHARRHRDGWVALNHLLTVIGDRAILGWTHLRV